MRERPVTYREFVAVIKGLGFAQCPKTGTSHEKWTRTVAGGRHVVTVDKHHAPFHRELLHLMLRQAGLSKRAFFRLLDGL